MTQQPQLTQQQQDFKKCLMNYCPNRWDSDDIDNFLLGETGSEEMSKLYTLWSAYNYHEVVSELLAWQDNNTAQSEAQPKKETGDQYRQEIQVMQDKITRLQSENDSYKNELITLNPLTDRPRIDELILMTQTNNQEISDTTATLQQYQSELSAGIASGSMI